MWKMSFMILMFYLKENAVKSWGRVKMIKKIPNVDDYKKIMNYENYDEFMKKKKF
jgi:hypothetical protein